MHTEAAIPLAPAKRWATLYLDMQTGQLTRPRPEPEMAEALRSRVRAEARRYRGAVMRYLLRTPLSLRPKYAAFLIDLAQQSDHMQEVLARASERLRDAGLAQALRAHQREERARMQLALSDVRRLGYQPENWIERQPSAGDAALRAYVTTLSYERPVAMLGVVLMIYGLAAEISPTIVRLLTVGGMPREAMKWLGVRETSDPGGFNQLLDLLARTVKDAADQTALLEAVEVTGELLALGAASRPLLPLPGDKPK